MDINSFDLDISEHIIRLIELANSRFPNARWTLRVVFWDDKDYKIELKTGGFVNGIPRTNNFSFKKSTNEYTYREKENICIERNRTLKKEKLFVGVKECLTN